MTHRTTKVFLDRIEGETAVLLDMHDRRTRIHLPVRFLPEGASESTIFDLTLVPDEDTTRKMAAEIVHLMESLTERREG